MSACYPAHSVFVLGASGEPLTPTTRARARKLLLAGAAEKVWSKFGTFGIKLSHETRKETPKTALGIDPGTKYEGYAVVCGTENNLAVKLDLPDKKKIKRKMTQRRILRRARRHRKCRRRQARFSNRKVRLGFIAPSQNVVVNSRLKIVTEFLRCYPVSIVALEDVRFDQRRGSWAYKFSTAEIGKTKMRLFLADHGLCVREFLGFTTQEIRKRFGYKKTRSKSADKFTAHCSDALALAVEVGPARVVLPGLFLVVNDTYRPVRRQLHDMQPAQNGIRDKFSRGTVFGLRKGLLVGLASGKTGRLCGEVNGLYRYYNEKGKRQMIKRLSWVSSNFVVRRNKLAA